MPISPDDRWPGAYVAANLDKRQYLDPKNLGIDSSLSAVTNGIFARMVAWLINDGARYPGAPLHYCGWAADRVALIGDEGPRSQIWDEIKAEDEQTDWENITLEVLKSIGEAEALDRLELWYDGWLTDDGEVVTSSVSVRRGQGFWGR